MVVGKWMYMSPEHTRNTGVDHRSDLFSLGVILYQACTGRSPFASQNPKDIVRKIREGEFRPVHELAPDAPPELAALIHRILSPDPANRPQTGQQFASELAEIIKAHELEGSSSKIARLLAEMFPEASSSVTLNPDADPLRVVTMSDGSVSGRMRTSSGMSRPTPTPTPRTSASLSRVDLDFSVSLVVRKDEEDESPPEPVPQPSESSELVSTLLLIVAVLAAAATVAYLVLWN
jgi:eukaryotic-like serine/threonine-protein kinase